MTNSRVMTFIRLARSPLLALVLLAPTVSQANKGDTYSLNINIDGTLVANGSCQFNQGDSLTVDFGDVKLLPEGTDTMTLDGNYRKSITSDFTCTGDTAGLLQMQLASLSGSYKSYNGTDVIEIDKGMLGVELLVNGAPQASGKWFTIDQSKPPTLEAELVQISTTNSKQVTNGDTFTASATLQLSFN